MNKYKDILKYIKRLIHKTRVGYEGQLQVFTSRTSLNRIGVRSILFRLIYKSNSGTFPESKHFQIQVQQVIIVIVFVK